MGLCDSSMDGVCWVLAAVVVAVLVYLGCCEMRKTSYVAARRATARAAANKEAPKSGVPITTDVFQEFDVDRSMTRVVAQDTYNVSSSMFLQEFKDGDSGAFRPINKEEALKSANTRPSQHMENGRDSGTKSRTVGLAPMEFARKTIHRTPTTGCVSFNDTDTRQTLMSGMPECGEDGCPYK